MAGERRDDEAMTGRLDALDAELTRLLDVTPSADFAARVRQRVRTAPPRAWWGLVFELSAAAAIVAALVFAYVSKAPAPRQVGVVARQDVALPPLPAVQPPEPDLRPVPPSRIAARRAPAPGVTPVVIVDPSQRVALTRMIQLAQEGKIDSTMLEPPPPTVLPLDMDVQVAPLAVHPLEVPAIPGARTDQK